MAISDDQHLLPYFPDDVALQIICRLPLSTHPWLALISRTFHDLIHHHSYLIFSVRSLLNISRRYPILTLRTPSSEHMCRYILLDSESNSPIPIPPPPVATIGSASVALGPFFIVLGGSIKQVPTSKVQIFDLRVKTWNLGPRMGIARQFPAVGVMDGGSRIYVLGGCSPLSESWAEVMDFESTEKKWEVLPSPPCLRKKWILGNAVLDGKILAIVDRGGVVFDPAMGSWGTMEHELGFRWRGRAVVVKGILYAYDCFGAIKGYDLKTDKWMEVEGLKEVPKFLAGATLTDIGGRRLLAMWEWKENRKRKNPTRPTMRVGLAEIELVVCGDGRLTGSVCRLESVHLPVPSGSTIAKCVTGENAY